MDEIKYICSDLEYNTSEHSENEIDVGGTYSDLKYSSSESESDSEISDIEHVEEKETTDKIETWEPDHDWLILKKGIASINLFNGSNKSVLTAIGERFATYTRTNMSKTTMSNLLCMEHDTLPQPNQLPRSYYEARKLISPYLIPVRTYDACINHCVVYRNSSDSKQYARKTECPVCMEPRYTRSGRSKRQLKYLPVGPRLARIYGNESLAAIMHNDISTNIPFQMTDIQDSPEYRKLFTSNGYFAGDKNGIVVGLEADGVAPYHSYNQTYSFTVVTMPVFNIMRKYRMLFRNIFIVMIIPGNNKSEASCQDAYIEILVDELLYLSKYSQVTDYLGAPVKLKIKLLLYILDYPGFCKLFHLSGSGAASGCIWCHISGIRCKHLNKMVYLSNRTYLQKDHPLRKASGFPTDNKNETKDRPKLRTQSEYNEYTNAYKQAFNKTQAATIASATGSKGPNPLMRLPGHDRPQESIPDGMHTVQRCLLNIHNLIIGKHILI